MTPTSDCPVDKSVSEILADDHARPPRLSDSLGIVFFSDGGQSSFKKLAAWEIAPANPY